MKMGWASDPSVQFDLIELQSNFIKQVIFVYFRIYNKHCFSQSEPRPRACACFHANYIKDNIKMHLYLKFEREIFKIVKVMAV